MELSSTNIVEMSIALIIGLIALAIASKASVESIFGFFVFLIPFQLVDTRYGSINMALAYFLVFMLYMRREIKTVPLARPLFLFGFVYLLSFSQVHPGQNSYHLFYLISLGSAVAVFVWAYNYAVRVDGYLKIFNVLHILNAFVVLYCVLQVFADKDGAFSLGSLTIYITPARLGWDMRLAGPFGSTMPGLFAEYLVISMLILFYDIALSTSRARNFSLYFLVALNLACLVATGNRGGIIGLVMFSLILLFSMRGVFGTFKTVKLMLQALTLFTVSSVLIIQFTEFDRLFDRLLETEIESGVPDTRALSWPAALAKFEKKPWLGHGPRFALAADEGVVIPDYIRIEFPHNLYLYLLCTIGIVGLCGFAVLFISILIKVLQAVSNNHPDDFLKHWPKVGLLIVFYILFDQIKIEYARYSAVDYWHYLFMILGIVLGLSDRAIGESTANSSAGLFKVRNYRVVRTA